jgi:lipid II:glycine glycyltransferase (peptidoglycan interpeptide bridge formation enzyme)
VQVLFRQLPLGLSMGYIPRGPVGNHWNDLWPEIDAACRKRRAVFLKMEPDQWETNGGQRVAPPQGFRLSPQSIQPPRTLVVSLAEDEETLLGRMKQKTRYNIKLALKKGILVRKSADLETFYRLMEVTSQRDQFGVHSLAYYRRAYELFYNRGECELFIAEYDGEPLAGLMVFCRQGRAWYFYGGSSNAHRDRMPTYLLQWETMRWARGQCCTEYDLWGVPDADEAALEAQFAERNDGLWGVYRFKRGFGGELRRSAGPWDRVYNPVLYAFYLWWTRRRETA